MVKETLSKVSIIGIFLASTLFAMNGSARAENQNISNTIYFSEWSRLRHLAELGQPDALFQLGNLYFQSSPRSGIPHNSKKAFELFMKAANKGHVASQHNIGVLYLKGLGVAQNTEKALAWFMIAADHGNKSAKRAVARLSTPNINKTNIDQIKKHFLQNIQTQQLAK